MILVSFFDFVNFMDRLFNNWYNRFGDRMSKIIES